MNEDEFALARARLGITASEEELLAQSEVSGILPRTDAVYLEARDESNRVAVERAIADSILPRE